MKKFLKILGLIILLIIAVVLISALFISKDYHLEREVTINAPQEKVWSHVNTLKGFQSWNPFGKEDPNVQMTYTGTDGTVGASYTWKGNSKVGEGQQTITKIEGPDRIETKLHFIEPMDGEATSYVQLTKEGAGTKVKWGFDSRYKYPMNFMKLFMDGMMKDKYDEGLAKLKSLSEAN
jgi:uncharacterized protein YndB with AHSA1/START domain